VIPSSGKEEVGVKSGVQAPLHEVCGPLPIIAHFLTPPCHLERIKGLLTNPANTDHLKSILMKKIALIF
jgi:hypothetical protein